MSKRQVAVKVEVVQKSDELGILWGWASVADIVDLQGDVIPQEVLIAAVYDFMADYYAGNATIKVNHDKPADVVLVESKLELLATHVAWWVGVKLLSDDLKKAAREGDISGFSIGGWAETEEEAQQ
jgi:hypothetical protein